VVRRKDARGRETRNRGPGIRYARELQEKKQLLEELDKQAASRTITLLYAAQDTEYNNAVALKELIER
jgi:uncharacterized protein YeaO (DUF488 family)